MSTFVFEIFLRFPTFPAPHITVCLPGISAHNALLAVVDSTDFHKTQNWSFKQDILHIFNREEMLIHPFYIIYYFLVRSLIKSLNSLALYRENDY